MTYCISRLLYEDLSKVDHGGIVIQSLRKIDHLICSILLVAILPSCQQRGKGCLRYWPWNPISN